MKRLFLILSLIVISAGIALAQGGVKKKRPLPHEYGRVIINNYSEKKGLAPVIFDHWLHRARFTCRVCHVDIGFAMSAGETGIKAADNLRGFYCGACHNGERLYNGKKIFASCSDRPSKEDIKRCERCHSHGRDVKGEYDFYSFTERLPKGRFGNGIDWEKAEMEEKIRLTDLLEGVSVKRKPLDIPNDYTIKPKVEGLPDIFFSHTKHTAWNGCELCHPDIFGVKAGVTKFTMTDIFAGKYCGLCHGKVAFPTIDCQRCHTKTVSR